MDKSKLLLAVTAATAFMATESAADNHDRVKCYGVAKAGQNDCGRHGGGHSCAGKAKTDYDPKEWKYMTKADCIEHGGGLTPKEAMKNKKKKKK